MRWYKRLCTIGCRSDVRAKGGVRRWHIAVGLRCDVRVARPGISVERVRAGLVVVMVVLGERTLSTIGQP